MAELLYLCNNTDITEQEISDFFQNENDQETTSLLLENDDSNSLDDPLLSLMNWGDEEYPEDPLGNGYSFFQYASDSVDRADEINTNQFADEIPLENTEDTEQEIHQQTVCPTNVFPKNFSPRINENETVVFESPAKIIVPYVSSILETDNESNIPIDEISQDISSRLSILANEQGHGPPKASILQEESAEKNPRTSKKRKSNNRKAIKVHHNVNNNINNNINDNDNIHNDNINVNININEILEAGNNCGDATKTQLLQAACQNLSSSEIETCKQLPKIIETFSTNHTEKFVSIAFPGETSEKVRTDHLEYEKNTHEYKLPNSFDYYAMYLSKKYSNIAQVKLSKYFKDRDNYNFKNVNKDFHSYLYLKRPRTPADTKIIYDNVSRARLGAILHISAEDVCTLEEFVFDIANELSIEINGERVPHSMASINTGAPVKNKTWNKKKDEIKLRVYTILQKIFWDIFHWDGEIVELLVKRVAYNIAQNKAKRIKNNDSDDQPNAISRKHIFKN